MNRENTEWSALTAAEKKRKLFWDQKKTLDLFLEKGAITQAQHQKSLGDLREKMGMQEEGESRGI